MSNMMQKVLTGIWYTDDGFIAGLWGRKFMLFVANDGTATDDFHTPWTVNNDGNLSSEQSCGYFSPDAGEILRSGIGVSREVRAS